MNPWYRIFSRSSDVPSPEALLDFLAARRAPVSGDFAVEDSDWYRADLVVESESLQLERYLAGEAGIRAELNSWAAWLETHEHTPDRVRLMERTVQTVQLFTLRGDGESTRTETLCVELCRFLAATTDGVYQIDERGFFDAEGVLLVSE